MSLAPAKWQALVFLSIIAILTAGCTGPNLATTLKADRTELLPGEYTSIECTVSNSPGDMSYEWSCSGGSIWGQGKAVHWFPPDSPGTYTINVQVKGENDKSSRASLSITVTENHAPVIHDLVVTAEHKYLKEVEVKGGRHYYAVGKDQMYNISCQAEYEGDDNLDCAWSCDKGEISGAGAKVIWKAPSATGDVRISVTVSDGKNGVATRDLLLVVVPCSKCTFG